MDCGFDKLRGLKDDYKWLYSNYEVFIKAYKNQLIAVKDEENLDNDINIEILFQKLKQNHFDGPIAIEYIYG